MQKLIFVGSRKPGMSREEYRHYVSEVHGPLVVKTPDVVAPMLKYVQHYPLYEEEDKAFGLQKKSDVDGIVEMVMKSVPEMLKSLQSQQYNDIIKPDEERMADRNSVIMHFVNEVEVIPGIDGPIKLYHFLKRKPGLSRKEFQTKWLQGKKQLLACNEAKGKLMSYKQNHILPDGTYPMGVDDEGIDIIDEYSFADVKAIEDFAINKESVDKSVKFLWEMVNGDLSYSLIVDWKVYVNR